MEIYSNCTGSFAIDGNKVVDSIYFEDPVKSNIALEKGQETPEEQKLLKKHPKAVLVRVSRPNIISLVSNDLQKIREISIFVTREKLKQAVKEDWFIVQASNNLAELDKAINLLCKRLREWYELYNPEFSNSIADHEKFVSVILTRSKQDLLKELKVPNTMGADLHKQDLDPIMNLAREIKAMFELSKIQENYLESLMKKECPNITAIAGVLIGAKLVTLAGSLERLSKFPASTVQLLGAEKALFRFLRSRGGRPPKYGILHEHALVSKVGQGSKGKMARFLADKISIASKVDFFKGKFVGDRLAGETEKKAKELSR